MGRQLTNEGLADGENFDGLGQSEFQNLKSVDVERATIGEDISALRISGDQTISSGTVTEATYNTSLFNNLGVNDPDNNRFVIAEGGSYLIGGWFEWGSSNDWTTGDRAGMRMLVNDDGVTPAYRQLKTGTGSEQKHFPVAKLELAEGDIITVSAFQDSGSDQIIKTGIANSRFSIGRLG